MDKQILLLVIIIFGVMAIAVYVTIILKNKKIALKGYDLVAYFEINQAIKGNRKFLYKYNNKTYYFVCEAHK